MLNTKIIVLASALYTYCRRKLCCFSYTLAPCGKQDRGHGTPTAQQPMKQVSMREKEPPSQLRSIAVASKTENSLEKPVSAHVRMRSMPCRHISLGEVDNCYKVTIKHIMRVLSFYMTYGNSLARSPKSRIEL